MRALVLAMLLMCGTAWADESLPTENEGPQTEQEAPAGKPDAGCHRCVQGPDGGYSDSDYSNPEGTYHTAAGDVTCCAPGMSQDWAENTGPYDPKTGNGTDSGAASKQSGGVSKRD